MDDIIAAAGELGKKIASHPRTRAFAATARAVATDAEAQALLKKYQDQADRIHQLEQSGRPVEPEDKRRLAALQSDLAVHEKLKEMMRCQADYLDLMNRINQAIDAAAQE